MEAVVTGDYGNDVPVRLQADRTQAVGDVTCVCIGSGGDLASTNGLEKVVVQPRVIGGKDAEENGDLISVEGGVR